MSQLTLRGVDTVLDQRLRGEAKQRGTSLNRTVLALLGESLGLRGQSTQSERTYDDLDHLIGGWTEDEAAEFDDRLRQVRRLDTEIWE